MSDPNLNSGPQFESPESRRDSIEAAVLRLSALKARREKVSAETALELIYDFDAKSFGAEHSKASAKKESYSLSSDKLETTIRNFTSMVGERTELIYENVSKSDWEGFAPYQEDSSVKYSYNPQVFEHLFVDDKRIRDGDLVLIKNNFEAKFTSEEIAEMSFDTFIYEVFFVAYLIDLARKWGDALEKNTYGLDGDLSELPEPERAEKLAKKKEVFEFFVEFEILPAGLDFNEVEADEDHEYHDFFQIAFVNLFESVFKIDDEGNLIEGESDEARYGKFIEKYAEILGVDKTIVNNNLNEYQKIYLETKKAEYFTGNPELFTSLIDVLEHLNKEEEEKEKKKKKKEEEKKPVDILAAISGVSDSSVEESSSAVGGEIIEQLDPPPYIQNFIKEGRVDDKGDYVCALKDYGVNLVFTQDPDTKEYHLEIKDQKTNKTKEKIPLNDKSGNKEWDRVEYNIDKLTSLAVVSDLGLTSFFNAGSELKMMQFVHLMATPNIDNLDTSKPNSWFKNSNNKETPLLNRSAAVFSIKKFFGLEGQNNITPESWSEALGNKGVLDDSGEILPVKTIANNNNFKAEKNSFKESEDNSNEDRNSYYN